MKMYKPHAQPGFFFSVRTKAKLAATATNNIAKTMVIVKCILEILLTFLFSNLVVFTLKLHKNNNM